MTQHCELGANFIGMGGAKLAASNGNGVCAREGLSGLLVENKEKAPYIPMIVVLTGTKHKVTQIRESLGRVRDQVVVGGVSMVDVDGVNEPSWINGEQLVKDKALQSWSKLNGRFRDEYKCFRNGRCWEDFVAVVSDVKVSISNPGQEFKDYHKVRTEMQDDSPTKRGLATYISGEFNKFGPEIVVRLDANGAAIKQVGEHDLVIARGTSRGYYQIPVNGMRDADYVMGYLDFVEERRGSLQPVVGSPLGLLFELVYDYHALRHGGEEIAYRRQVMLNPPPNDYGMSDKDYMTTHAFGFPPELVGALLSRVSKAKNGGVESVQSEGDMRVNFLNPLELKPSYETT